MEGKYYRLTNLTDEKANLIDLRINKRGIEVIINPDDVHAGELEIKFNKDNFISKINPKYKITEILREDIFGVSRDSPERSLGNGGNIKDQNGECFI